MKKFECEECLNPCILNIKVDYCKLPKMCPYDNPYPIWHEVKEDKEIKAGESEQLPEWVKECAVGYDNEQKRYFEVTNVSEEWVDIEYLDDGNGATCNYTDMQNCSEALKRPFNAEEMRALVGKIIDFPNYDRAVILDYIHRTKKVYMKGYPYSASELFNEYFTVDGKPCCKFEHLENGEWVE